MQFLYLQLISAWGLKYKPSFQNLFKKTRITKKKKKFV